MTRVAPIPRDELAEFEPLFQIVENVMGFVPESMLTMAHRSDLLRAFAGLSGTILGPGGALAPGLRQLVAHVSSRASGCRYCQAHTAHSAHRAGVDAAKLDVVFEYATHPLFDARERAALRLANDAGVVPNAATDAHFEELRRYFSPEEIVDLVGVISLFGYLNRWNDTMATTLEPGVRDFAEKHLSASGWRVDKHT